MSNLVEEIGAVAVSPMATNLQVAQAPTLDALSAGPIRAEHIKSELAQGGQKVLSVVTEFQFQSDAARHQADAKSNLGPGEEIDKHAQELQGADPSDATLKDNQTQATIELVRDIYLATAKTMVAWKVVDGVGKDTKAMLQTQ